MMFLENQQEVNQIKHKKDRISKIDQVKEIKGITVN